MKKTCVTMWSVSAVFGCLVTGVSGVSAQVGSMAATDVPGVEKVEAVCIGGKTYLSFKKGNPAETNIGYQVYRFTEVPADAGALMPIARLPATSHEHPDNHTAFVLPDGRKLTPDDGLFVYTPKKKETVWYGVLPETAPHARLMAGKNVTAVPLNEEPSDIPGAVLQKHSENGKQVTDFYASWMDYDAWEKEKSPGGWQWKNKPNEYYGSFFSISYLKGDTNPCPAIVTLHSLNEGCSGGANSLMARASYYRIWVVDHRQWWWDGKAAPRIDQQIGFLVNCSKYNIDKNRLYVEGNSMGGHGSIVHALKYPDRYAAIYSKIANIGTGQLSLIKPDVDLPAIVTFFGFIDSYGHKLHAPFIRKMQENRQGVWTKWANIGHSVPGEYTSLESCVPGGMMRFKRNELFPVFMNTSIDDNCGQKEGTNVVTAGQVNQTIDWASALHPLDVADSALVDQPGELSVTFKATTNCTTDLAFRRIQSFVPAPGKRLSYRNIDVASGNVLQEGEIVVPGDKIWVIERIQMTTTGNRVSVRSLPDGNLQKREGNVRVSGANPSRGREVDGVCA